MNLSLSSSLIPWKVSQTPQYSIILGKHHPSSQHQSCGNLRRPFVPGYRPDVSVLSYSHPPSSSAPVTAGLLDVVLRAGMWRTPPPPQPPPAPRGLSLCRPKSKPITSAQGRRIRGAGGAAAPDEIQAGLKALSNLTKIVSGLPGPHYTWKSSDVREPFQIFTKYFSGLEPWSLENSSLAPAMSF